MIIPCFHKKHIIITIWLKRKVFIRIARPLALEALPIPLAGFIDTIMVIA